MFHGAWPVWLYRALVLLVIACPCALVISTPVSIVASLAAAARNGVLVKGGEFIEIPARLKAIAFDKSGTLTTGRLAVVQVVPRSGHDEPGLMERAAGIKHLIVLTGDNRPTADAIGREAGVDEILTELLPADKVAAVESLVDRYAQVAMVGDGIDDAPAMSRANLGIAMGAAGSDAAIAADMGASLLVIFNGLRLLRLGTKTA